MEATLGESLEENLLILLAFDDEKCTIIRGTVDAALFTGQYRVIVAAIYKYIDVYKEAPKDNLPDILTDKLNSDNKREAHLYADIIDNLYEMQNRGSTEFAMKNLENFIRRQALRSVGVDLINALKKDTEESLDEADEIIKKSRSQGLTLFNPGVRLSNADEVLKFLDIREASLPTGIKELDKRNLGPTRKELSLYIAKFKSGKTWWLTGLARAALVHRYNVCHISLEVSQNRTIQRYMQNMFSLSNRKEKFFQIEFVKNKYGRLVDFDDKEVVSRLQLTDPDIREQLEKKIKKYANRFLKHIIVKEFPRGRLTVPGLESYLDNLEVTEKFVPDLLIIDYPDLMKLDKGDLRLSLDEVYKDICGLLSERNMAGAVVSQSHRLAANLKENRIVGGENVAEAYTKVAHADTIIAYSQTAAEKALGLARLSVAGARHDQDDLTLIISQNYNIGKFHVDSAVMEKPYWDLVEESKPNEDAEDD